MVERISMKHEEIKKSIAERYPEHIVKDKAGNKYFDMRGLFKAKGWIK